MAVKGELSVWNHENTQLEGPRGNKSSLVFEYEHEVYMPFDREDNKLQGTRRIDAFSVTKEIDKLTPQLYEIVCKGRNCKKVQISLYRIAKDGGDEEEYFRYILEDAKIISVRNHMPITKYEQNENIGHLETVRFLAKSFSWQYLEGGVEYTEVSGLSA
ncbi:type VI secretion system tube protein Hcp [bacterium]|nr:MAG: type VI secretion system tube protein Hcp [candidate division KSB1 bacterium]MCE7942487.1 type VI secretion system tube protein Hcp [Chlorobi bacterium CHB1]MCL4709077.1 type VI secretion system tube protein Hcp [bacterium]MBC6946560.1 type VI secretion system tube protein Hcp [candidate division KSB1 bacterium]NUM75170.1 type VI secretion system tube protein Hcp [candidate division KSB1 bacterium]